MRNYYKLLLVHALSCLMLLQLSAGERSYVIPQLAPGMEQIETLLNGAWNFKPSLKSGWTTIQVPGEVVMQGYAIEHDQAFRYRKSFVLPDSYRNKRVILRFDGVYSHACLAVNGKKVREHFGGFTRWETDITSYVKIGKKNEIELEVTDRLDDISYASGYAHHPIGGILRDVTIFALPETHIFDFYAETVLDASYKNAVLKLGYSAFASEEAEIRYTLLSPQGKRVELPVSVFPLKKGENMEVMDELPVSNVLKWDAEHPNLYSLTVSIWQKGREISRFCKKIGFREVRIVKERMLVNGMPIKLRGACRHDIHPTLGRTTTEELDSLDAVLFKRANMNFVRTSHYPPTERFLEYCDKLGLYVECETAVCFVDTYRQKNYKPGKSQDDADFTHRYLSQCMEMVKSLRSHSSIIFWSIGNESRYGDNFRASWDWMKKTDPARPVIFSWPGTVKGEDKIYDILSMHYPNVNGSLNQFGMTVQNFEGYGVPALFDEWAHPACYTYETLREDPNIREFWGASLDKMWSKLFNTSGGLGGAIWGYIDETFMVPEQKVGEPYWKTFARTAKPEEFQGNCVGYGEWGIVDVWRREKPEFWSTKKAYSPVRLSVEPISSITSGERLIIPVHNRFDHTNLSEINIRYTRNGNVPKTISLNLAPHEKGNLILPDEDWQDGDRILVEFYTAGDQLIDANLITIGEKKVPLPYNSGHKRALRVTETDEFVIVEGDNFTIPFSRHTGLICNAVSAGKVVLESGPFLNLNTNLNHLTGAEVRKAAKKFILPKENWVKKDFVCQLKDGKAEIALSGEYGGVKIDFQMLILPEGQIEMNYIVSDAPNGYVRESGLSFLLPDIYNYLRWERKGYWDYYQEGAFAGNNGCAPLYNNHRVAYRENPQQAWQLDTHNYYYWADAGANCHQPLTQIAKGLKENIYYYTLSQQKDSSGLHLSVISPDASLACRTSKGADEQLVLYIMSKWDYPEIAWGNYCKTLEASPCFGKLTIVL